jgi:endonuclease YncB( thermonuclease family)
MNNRRPTVAPFIAAIAVLMAGVWPAFGHVLANSQATSKPAQAEPLPEIPKANYSAADLCAVSSVVDGDNATVVRGDQRETVRLLGVDTPEAKDPRKEVQFYAKEASGFLTNLLRGESVYVVPSTGTLAHVYRADDGLWVNLEIVRQGHGQVYSGDAFKDINLFLAYQRTAREAKRGLWDPGRTAPAPQPTDKSVVPVPIPVSAPAANPCEAAKPVPEKVIVYVTNSGSKYHRAGCTCLKSSIPMDLSEAKARYSPCSRCNPPN